MDYTDLFGQYSVPPSEAQYSFAALTVNSTLAWPNNFSGQVATEFLATTSLDVTSAAGLSLRLPPANQVSVGAELRIRNVGANTLNIQDSAGGGVTAVAPGAVKYFQVTDNDSPAGVWATYTFGTGTSGADAGALAGEGLTVLSNRLHVDAPYRGLNSSYTLQLTDRAHALDAVVGGLVVTLPLANTVSAGYYVLLRNSSSGSLTLDPSESELIDGAPAKAVSPLESLILISTGSGWISVGFGRDATFVFGEVVVNAAVSPVTLSSADVAGRMIRVSGTASTNLTVNLPAIDNVYFINVEAGVGVFSVTFTTGSGVSTVLTANQKTVVYCDGINVTPAITTTVTASLSLTDGSAAAPAIAFALDANTGFFRDSDGVVGLASNGVATVLFGPNGIVFASTQGLTANNLASACDELKVLVDSLNTTLSGSITSGLALKANKAGDTFTGPVSVPAGATGSQVPRVSEVTTAIGAAITASEATTNAAIALKVNKAGDVFTGPVSFNAEYDAGNSGTAKTINFNNGQKQKLTFTGNCTITFTFPAGVGNYVLRGIGDGTTRTVTWPAGSKYPNAVAPLAPLTNGTAIYTVYYDGAVAHISGTRES